MASQTTITIFECLACEMIPCTCTSDCCMNNHPDNKFCTQCGVRNQSWWPAPPLHCQPWLSSSSRRPPRRSSRVAYCLWCSTHCEHSGDSYCGLCGWKFRDFNMAPHYLRFMPGGDLAPTPVSSKGIPKGIPKL